MATTVHDQMPNVPIDFERLENYLKVLSHANRLRLLSLLRVPKPLDAILLNPGPSQAGHNPTRPISRQAVQGHLKQLVDLGIVRVRSTNRRGTRALYEYVLDQARLYALLEEFRRIGTLETQVPLDPFATEGLPETRPKAWEPGPKLVLVYGASEGRTFPLRPSEQKKGRGWIIGRSRNVHVSLEYDPYVSAENAEVLRAPDGFRLMDLRTAKNGTLLNWQRLPVGGEARLQNGDVIGVGRSLLVFRDN